jgi:diacylglycerol kinase (ATP)
MTRPRPMFVVNPAAGGGRGRRVAALVRARLDERGVTGAEVVFTERPGHATTLARDAAAAGFAPIVGVAGDGTLSEIANGLLDAEDAPPLAVVPVGTGNDFARSLALPTDLAAAVDLAVSDVAPRAIDVGRCGARCFLNTAGVGFDAEVGRAVNSAPSALRHGALPFVLYTLLELTRSRKPLLRIRLDDTVIEQRAFMVSIGNGPCSGGGMRICPDASRDDGLLDVCIVGDVSRLEVVRLLPKVFSGGHTSHPKVDMRRARTVRVEGPAGTYVQVDGEVVGTLPAEFSVLPSALRVIAPGPPTGA